MTGQNNEAQDDYLDCGEFAPVWDHTPEHATESTGQRDEVSNSNEEA